MAKQHHTPEARLDVSKKICRLYATDKYSIGTLCQNQGITTRTFEIWRKENSQISDLFNKAKIKAAQAKKVRLKRKALTALELHLDVRETTETIVDGDGKVTVKTKTVLPSPTTIIFALKNVDAANWKDKQEVEVKEKLEGISLNIKRNRDAA